MISNLFPPVVRGGYELLCAEAVNGLRDGHEVLVLSSRAGSDVPPEPHVVRELEWLEQGPRGALRAPAASVRAARTTRALLASFEPDLVFVWNGAHIPRAALWVAEQSGAAIAYSVAEHWFARLYMSDQFTRYLLPGERGLRALWGRVVRVANRHPALRLDVQRPMPASIAWISDALRRTGPPPTITPVVERVIHPAPIAPERWASVVRQPASAPPTIAFVGRVEQQKGPAVAYRAVAELRDRHRLDVRLELAGGVEPAQGTELDRLAAELGIADRVTLDGQLDHEAVRSLLGRASALVVPSTWEEPFGLVLLEGALARVPVVASWSGGMPEALHEERHALSFPSGDAGACADALARVLTRPSETQARIERAFERACRFSSRRYRAQLDHFALDAVAAHEHRLQGGQLGPQPVRWGGR